MSAVTRFDPSRPMPLEIWNFDVLQDGRSVAAGTGPKHRCLQEIITQINTRGLEDGNLEIRLTKNERSRP